MQTSRSNNRQAWLNAYRVVVVTALVGIAVMLGSQQIKIDALQARSFMPIDTVQANKVERAAAFLQDVGFNDPIYLGITPGAEGEYPTFQATAIGGKPIKLWIRTTPNGGWEIQPVGVFETVSSADDFARLAQRAVYEWENMPADTKPRTDGAYGEYESRKHNFELLGKYNPDKSYWQTKVDETRDWPRQ